jgi:phasin family protein
VAQAMFAAKTLKDVVDVQTGYAKASMDTIVAEGKKINDMTLKVANEAFEPIQVQVNETIGKVLKQSAA